MNARTNEEKLKNMEKYPVMPKGTTRKKALEVNQEDFLYLQLCELQNHMEIYRIHELYNALRTPLKGNDKESEVKRPFFDTFNLKKMAELSKHLQNLQPESEKSLSKNESCQFIFKSINIEQNLIMNLREQIKLCYYLQRFFDKATVKYPELKPFQMYLNGILAK